MRRNTLPGVLGTSTVFDQGVERTREEAERKGDAVLKKIAAGLQEADASRGEKLDMSGGPY